MKSRAFTLIELSIALVIVGLIVGGVLVGQDLIKAAQFRKITSQHEGFKTAVNTFKLKYNCLPGDCSNATQFWGAVSNDALVCNLTSSGTQTTCNGDGNGKVNPQVGYVGNEVFRFWQQLSNAGYISGTFSGIDGSAASGVHHQIGVNSPSSAISGTGWGVDWAAAGYGGMFTHSLGNYFILGAETSANVPYTNAFTPEEAWRIDSKTDDGMPGSGEIVVRDWANCTDAISASDFSGPYNMNNPNKHCTMLFRNQF